MDKKSERNEFVICTLQGGIITAIELLPLEYSVLAALQATMCKNNPAQEGSKASNCIDAERLFTCLGNMPNEKERETIQRVAAQTQVTEPEILALLEFYNNI